jgi:hypothetical protein
VALQAGRLWVRFPKLSLEFFIDIFPDALWPLDRLSLYQDYFLRVKEAGAYGSQTYHLHVPIVMKSGSLNLPEPSGPVMGLLYIFTF